MTRPQRLFGRRPLQSEITEVAPQNPQSEFSRAERFSENLGYNVGDVSCPPAIAQKLRALGYNSESIRDIIHTVTILESTSGRKIHPVVFARIRKCYNIEMSILAALASICRQEAADLGLVLRSLVRLYKRKKLKKKDLDRIESFVSWVVSRGEPIRGVPTAWDEYLCRHRRRK